MTVIAWDGKTLAADKQMGTDFPRMVTKIRRTKAGELLGASGWMGQSVVLMDWWEAGADPATFSAEQKDDAKSSTLLIIKPDGSIWSLCGTPKPYRIEEDFHSIGSGRDFAAAAMFMGRSAEQAVKVAIALCGSCGGGVDILELENGK